MFTATMLVFALVAQAPTAAEESEPDFDTLVQDAMRDHKAGRYLEAAASFQRAYAMQPEPRLMYNIARCYEKAPDLDKAIESFETFLRLSGTTAELRGRARKSLTALEGEKQSLEPPPPPPPIELSPEPPAAPAPTAATSLDVTRERSSRSRTLEWTLIGGGVVAAGAGAVFGVLALNEEDRFRQADVTGRDVAEDAGRRNALIADLLIGAGVVSAAIGTIMFLVVDDQPATTVGAILDGNGGTLVIGRRF